MTFSEDCRSVKNKNLIIIEYIDAVLQCISTCICTQSCSLLACAGQPVSYGMTLGLLTVCMVSEKRH